jgi:hypothetical protein
MVMGLAGEKKSLLENVTMMSSSLALVCLRLVSFQRHQLLLLSVRPTFLAEPC